MNDTHVYSVKEIERILNLPQSVKLGFKDTGEAYRWVQNLLERLRYFGLSREKKGILREYIYRVTGYSNAQTSRLIKRFRATGKIKPGSYQRNNPSKKYLPEDIALLAKTDQLHSFPNGYALKKTLECMFKRYGLREYRKISDISVGHIYNLRRTKTYQRTAKRYQKTDPRKVNIGKRRKPDPQGRPGFIRIDSVHQGDFEGEKGVYHVNTVDEVVQFEMVGATEKLTVEFMVPLLIRLIDSYPFIIKEFHADNGSEIINHTVADLFNELLIVLSKSRPRKSNDNALVEGKNGAIIRKWMGYSFIKQKYARRINDFYFDFFNEYLNFHRSCAFPREVLQKNGKVKKAYKYEDYMTPYEKLRNLPDAERYLKEGITFERLDQIEMGKTDNGMAEIVQKERAKLFDEILMPHKIKSN